MPEFELSKINPSVALTLQAGKTPDRTAITDFVGGQERSLSFKELDNRIDSLANFFLQSGVRVGDRMAVISGNRIEIAEAFMAAMRIGMIPYSVNPNISQEQVKYILDNSNPRIVLVETVGTKNSIDTLNTMFSAIYIAIGEGIQGFLRYGDIVSKANRLDEAYRFNDIPQAIIYTSGSTGFPKGVLRKLFKLDRKYPEIFAGIEIFASEEKFQAVPSIISWPMFHVGGLAHVTGALPDGSPLVIMRYFEPASYLKLLSKHKVRSCSFLPNQLSMCLKEKDLIDSLDFSLKLCFVGGSSSSDGLITEAQKAFGCPVISGYGMTEGAPMFTFDGVDLDTMPVGACGKAEKDADVQLIDAAGKKSDFGELWFKNETLFDEYYKRPDIMAEKFDGDWFKTGDVFYRDKDGFYFHRGRSDDMFICDGENIYPQEIENILSKHSAVLHSCVTYIEHDESRQVPVAMVECKPSCKVTEGELRKHYLEHGQLYAYPRIIKFVDKLPSLGPGKVDRPKIRTILSSEFKNNSEEREPDEECIKSYTDEDIDSFVTDTWNDIVKSDSIDMQQNVFDLGMNSIQVTIFVERAKQQFDIPFQLQDVFELETLSAMADNIKGLVDAHQLIDHTSEETTAKEII